MPADRLKHGSCQKGIEKDEYETVVFDSSFLVCWNFSVLMLLEAGQYYFCTNVDTSDHASGVP